MADHADLQIYQGDDYAATVTVTNADGSNANLAGYSSKAQIRRDVADNDPIVVVEITTSIASPFINLSLTHVQTAALADNYVWDLQITDTSGAITTILAGAVIVTQEVTRVGAVA